MVRVKCLEYSLICHVVLLVEPHDWWVWCCNSDTQHEADVVSFDSWVDLSTIIGRMMRSSCCSRITIVTFIILLVLNLFITSHATGRGRGTTFVFATSLRSLPQYV
jgi:hypothetical protein